MQEGARIKQGPSGIVIALCTGLENGGFLVLFCEKSGLVLHKVVIFCTLFVQGAQDALRSLRPVVLGDVFWEKRIEIRANHQVAATTIL